MKVKIAVVGILALFLISISLFFYFHIGSQERFVFKTKRAAKGDIVRTISATGTVNPVTIVNVGAQVSGKVCRLFADFNSLVKKEDIIAKIDPELFERDVEEGKARLASAKANLKSALDNVGLAGSTVRSAEANLQKMKASFTYAQREYERYVDLYKRDLVSASERDLKESNYKQAIALIESAVAELAARKANLAAKRADHQAVISQVKSAEAALNRAKTNLNYTIIRSPVDGIVLSREVDEGQTLTAKLQTPVLFKIAEDLTKMRLNASIDEADIGCIKMGQDALFTVDAFPYTTFNGVVKQVRITPVIVQNVVTYDVIIEVENRELKLKPGMTANVTIMVEHRDNVIRIPNEALRFTPPWDIELDRDVKVSLKERNSRLVWRLDKEKNLEPVQINTGMADGEYTELLHGDISDGDELVMAVLDKNGRPIISEKTKPRTFRGFRP
jgi:HlyD family secretion protein